MVRFRMVALVACAWGCSGAQEDTLAAFLGGWQTSGAITTSCDKGRPTDTPSAGTLTIARGADGSLVAVEADCALRMDVVGNLATVRPQQVCKLLVVAVPVDATFTSGSFSVTGRSARFDRTAMFTLGRGTAALECTYSVNGTARRNAP